MGCDIHMVVEKRDKERERWVGLHAFPYARVTVYGRIEGQEERVTVEDTTHWRMRWRNYGLFAAIAGVRGKGPAPRGMPDDASDLAVMEVDEWGSDGHSHTWMLLSEALRPFVVHQIEEAAWATAVAGKLTGMDDWEWAGSFLEHFGVSLNDGETLDDYRLVIWFDN